MKMQPSEFKKDSSLFDKIILEEVEYHGLFEEGLGLRIATTNSEINTRSTGTASMHQVLSADSESIQNRPQTTHFHKGRPESNSNVNRKISQLKESVRPNELFQPQSRTTPRQNSATGRKHIVPSLCIPATIATSSRTSDATARSTSSARADHARRAPLKPKPPLEEGVRCTPRPGMEFNEQLTFRIMERLHSKLKSSPLACSARPWTSGSKKKSHRTHNSPPSDQGKDFDHKFECGESIDRPRCKRPAWNNSTLNTLFNPRKIDISPRKWQLMNGVSKRPATTYVRENMDIKDHETSGKGIEANSKNNEVSATVDNAQVIGVESLSRRSLIPPLPFCPTDLQFLERPETRRGLSSSSRSSLWCREFAEMQTGVTDKMNLGPAFMSGREFEPLYTEGEQKRLLSDMGYDDETFESDEDEIEEEIISSVSKGESFPQIRYVKNLDAEIRSDREFHDNENSHRNNLPQRTIR
eukprot:748821-Hanusia_phi.AAC.4